MARRSSTPPAPAEIAIAGYACRLPSACDAEAFWSLMMDERSAIRPIPSSRFDMERFYHPTPGIPGKSYVKSAGLLDEIYEFDAGFFGVSPREAEQMDPQQRLLLEVTWEAIEHAFLTRDEVSGPRTGVYVGASSCDHMASAFESPAAMGPNFMAGNTMSILANRIAYHFDIKGPSATIDTACSSSFYALHQAARAIECGEIDTAIVAGVNMLLSPYPFIGFSQASMLSPDGECRAFDARANGYVRSEGAVVFVLQRRSEDFGPRRTRSLLAGIAVNSDGSKSGLSLPSAQGQAQLLEQVWSGIDHAPDQIAFVEAHGTGTAVGDPIEATALGQTLAKGRGNPLAIGSAKTNVGHLEAGSGLVGLLKAQLALERGVLPPSRNFEAPNPDIDFVGLNLNVAAKPVSLDRAEAVFAGVNSFGFGGTNAHAALKRVALPSTVPAAEAKPSALIISAASAESLGKMVAVWRDRARISDRDALFRDASAAAHHRTWHSHRLVIAGNQDEVPAALDCAAEGQKHPTMVQGEAPPAAGKTAFVFSGNGAQWAGMGLDFLDREPDFRAAFEEVSDVYGQQAGVDLVSLLRDPALSERLDDGLVAQPLLFAVQVALVKALRQRGLAPAVVTGHSVGEVAAAWAAGCLTLEQGCRLIHARASAMADLRGRGGMAAVLASAAATRDLLEKTEFSGLEIAGDNSPRSTTVSGDAAQVAEFCKAARQHRVAVQKLPVAYPYHSAEMESIRDVMISSLSGLRGDEGNIPFVSSTTGEMLCGVELTPEHWWRNARDQVRFRQAISKMCELGVSTFVEIGPRPVLQTYILDTAKEAGKKITVTASLNKGARAPVSLDLIVAKALAGGAVVEREAFFGAPPEAPTDLPAYQWNRRRYVHKRAADRVDLLGHEAAHPLLGHRAHQDGVVWRSEIDSDRLPWLADHMVAGRALMPATGFVEIALAAARTQFDGPLEIRDLDIVAPLPVPRPKGSSLSLRTSLERETGLLRIESRPQLSDDEWQLHARCVIAKAPSDAPKDAGASLAFLTKWSAEELYAALSGAGLDYGPSFRRVTRLTAGSGMGMAELDGAKACSGMALDPALADAALHGLLPLLRQGGKASVERASFLPVRFGRVRVYCAGDAPRTAQINLRSQSSHGANADIRLLGEDGRVIADLTDLRLDRVRSSRNTGDPLPIWQEVAIPLEGPAHVPAILEEPIAVARRLGLLANEEAEVPAKTLLLDAAARRIAWDALKAEDDSEEPLPSWLKKGMKALLAADLADEDDPARQPLPELSDIVRVLIENEPSNGSDILRLIRQRLGLSLIAQGEGAMNLDAHGSTTKLWTIAEPLLIDTISDWPADAPLRLMLLGQVPAGLVEQVLQLRPSIDLSVSSSRVDTANHLRARFQDDPRIAVLVSGGAQPTDCHDLAVACEDLLATPESGRPADMPLAGQARIVLALEAEQTALDELNNLIKSGFAMAGLPNPSDAGAVLTRAGFRCSELLVVENVRLHTARRIPTDALVESPCFAEPMTLVGSDERLEQMFDLGGSYVHYPSPDAWIKGASAGPLGRIALILRGSLAEMMQDIRKVLPRLDQISALWIFYCPCERFTAVDAAGLRGYLRVLRNEHPDVDIRLVALDPDAPIAGRIEEILDRASETEVHVDDRRVSSPRLLQLQPLSPVDGLAAEETWQLGLARHGRIESVGWHPVSRRVPSPREVEIETCAAGLNFRDVLWAQRRLPAEALEAGYAGAGFGMECAGHVVRAGEESGFAPGDRVMAFAPNAFSSHVIVPGNVAMTVPDTLDLETAAGLPVAFLTAHYALIEQARLLANESVLIHGAAGGVGQAAIQIAKHLGARVFCTAGSEERRTYLELMGADGVFESRNLAFAADLEAATDGEGVDVVLNCLAGEAMDASLRLLRPFGRFIELGKQDLYTNRHVGLRALRNNVSYHAIDLDQLMHAQPDRIHRVVECMKENLARGDYRPIPAEIFPSDQVDDALRLMQGAGHLGKIVVQTPRCIRSKQIKRAPMFSGGWVVIGGHSGLGLATAEWLADRGANLIWLVSRTGAARHEAERERIARLTERTTLYHIAADVSDADAVEKFFQSVGENGVQLRGIIHAAMVLDDDRIEEIDPERLARVCRPKVEGAALLDRFSRPHSPDHFIVFSSLSSLLGNPGQAAYAAANGTMEEVIRARRAEGLPALSLGLGPIADTGHLQRNIRLRDQLAGLMPGALITSEEVLSTLGALIADPPLDPVVYAGRVPWDHLAGRLAAVGERRFQRVASSRPGGLETTGSRLSEIALLGDEEARDLLLQALVNETARVLRLPEAEVDPYRPMADLGFDSLMAVDLKLSVEESLGTTLPMMTLGDKLTLADLTRKILSRLRAEQPEAAEPSELIETMVSRHVAVIEGDQAREPAERSREPVRTPGAA
ncbi:MAG: type I polyketide synthase [Pseudomonadota bacterium]